jgi:hypothetical protein
VETYAIMRRGGWRTLEELRAATARSTAEGDKTPDDIRLIRSYLLAETNGSLGTLCICQASSPEAIRRHATAAALPVDEIVAVADTIVLQPDPQPVAA